jgi:YidC/Oxa1 family membrane protein insertase
MADSSNGPGPSPTDPGKRKPKRELSIEIRLVLAFVLMGLVLFLTPYLYKPAAPSKTIQPVPQPPPKQVVSTPPPIAAPPVKAGDIAPVAASQEKIFTVDTDLYRVVFSNRGASVRSWILKKYLDAHGRSLELVAQSDVQQTLRPFSLDSVKEKPSADLSEVLFSDKPAADGLGIDYEFSNGRTVARKSFRFVKNSYLSRVAFSVTENGAGLAHLLTWRAGFGDASVQNAAASQHAVYFDVARNELVVNEAKVAKDGAVSVSGAFSFAGIEDTYFAAVFLPSGSDALVRTYSDTIKAPGAEGKEEPHVGAGVGGDTENRLAVYVGPKDIDILRAVDPKLEQIVDFGWFAFIAKPLFLALNWLNDRWIHNFGWSIVVITIIINFLLWPLRFSSMKSMKKMAALQPKIAEINAKYKNIGLRDPRKAQQNQEVMELYRKHGVNPMGGCLPLLLQMPFFIAFYKVLTVAIELRGAQWLWVRDLSIPETIPIRVLPLTMMITGYIQQKMTPSTSPDPAQQRMMMLMPLMMGFLFWSVSSGLVLYWLTGNVVGIAQQWIMNRMAAVPAASPVAPPAPKKKGSRS